MSDDWQNSLDHAPRTMRPMPSRRTGCWTTLTRGFLLLAVGFEAACATHPVEPDEVGAALERYRAVFATMRPGALAPSLADPNYTLFVDVMRLVSSSYVKPADPERLVDAALDGLRKQKKNDGDATERALTESAIETMLVSLDPYSHFLDAEHVRDMRDLMLGEFTGIGVEVVLDQDTGFLRVASANANTPAARAGVRSGDLITRINGREVKGLSLHDAVTAMRGSAGETLTLELLRPGGDVPIQVFVNRAVVRVDPIHARLDGRIGYIRITYFNERTTHFLRDALDGLRRQADGALEGLVLDLRDNPGGLFEQGVKVAAAFLGPVEIVSTRGREVGVRHYSGGTDDDVAPGLPLAVLIDGGTTSAAEVVAGALQDHRRALLFGGRSYGKGSVQTIFQLAGGDGLRLTTARYFRPSGGPVECFGITPNVAIEPASRPPPGARSKAPVVEEARSDPASCDPGTVPPARPRTWPMAELCPDVAKAMPSPEVDGPLDCAVAAIRTHRVEGASLE